MLFLPYPNGSDNFDYGLKKNRCQMNLSIRNIVKFYFPISIIDHECNEEDFSKIRDFYWIHLI